MNMHTTTTATKIPSAHRCQLDQARLSYDNERPLPQSARKEKLRLIAQQLCMAENPKQLGAYGERYAAAWLELQGWYVLERNWRTRFGELDIIMLDTKHTVVFVEVKTRRSTRQGLPQEAVTSNKQANLRHAALAWLHEVDHRISNNGLRFDVITNIVGRKEVSTRHIKEAF